jgi:RNA polymerase sigma-70 factor (ECF subfamily)
MKTPTNNDELGNLNPNQIIKNYKPLVVKSVSKVIKNKMDSEEVVQDALIKTLENLKKFNPDKGSFATWIATLAKNTALDFVRKKDYKIWSNSTDVIPEDYTKESEPDRRLLLCRDFLKNSFRELNVIQSQIINLRFNENKSYEEIASLLNISIENTRVLNHRAIEKLRAVAIKKQS